MDAKLPNHAKDALALRKRAAQRCKIGVIKGEELGSRDLLLHNRIHGRQRQTHSCSEPLANLVRIP